MKGAALEKRGVYAWMTQLVGPGPTKRCELFCAIFQVPWKMFVRIHKELIAHRPEILSTAEVGVRTVGFPSDVKVVVFLRLISMTR